MHITEGESGDLLASHIDITGGEPGDLLASHITEGESGDLLASLQGESLVTY